MKMTPLETVRHSCAHVLANGILKIWPEAQFAAGPPVEQGFYYDVEMPHRVTPEDFSRIEKEMRRIVKQNQAFERITVSRAQAIEAAERGSLAALGDRPEPSKFKLDILQGIPDSEEITFYRNGEFTDLCAGPHVAGTGEIGAFRLTHVASAYYKGDERNPQLQRIYGIAFATQEELDRHFEMLEEAKKRDHRKLGAELGLFAIDTEYVGPGLPLWLPKGTILVEELEKLAKETEFAAGYQRVKTPHIAKEKMYKTSGHLPYYAESMFPPMEIVEGTDAAGDEELRERYYLKAMNCPHHHRVFAAQPHSYRDLPMRLAEYGCCYRYEQSGELFGLMRVRSMNMNDAHIYCTPEQFSAEFNAVNDMYLKYFKIFGFDKYLMRFSTHDPAKLGQKFVNEPELWKQTEDMVRDVLTKSGINFVEVPNEAAFYGPKIDVQVWSVIGREFTLATNQVDFSQPRSFNLNYTDRDNTKKIPLCIHRAPLGTHERFIGFLIEHYAGAFPTWLAPEQVRVLSISDKLADYAGSVFRTLRDAGIRAALDDSPEKIGAKIRLAQTEKVPYMLVLGGREEAAQAVAVRSRKKGDEGACSITDFLMRIQTEIGNRDM